MIGFIPGLGMQEIILLGLCVLIPLGGSAVVLVVMRLSRTKSRDRDDDDRSDRGDEFPTRRRG